jgi:hypothetical protein
MEREAIKRNCKRGEEALVGGLVDRGKLRVRCE